MFANCRLTFFVFRITIEALIDSYTIRLHVNNRTQINNQDCFFPSKRLTVSLVVQCFFFCPKGAKLNPQSHFLTQCTVVNYNKEMLLTHLYW